jgi:hypothetical protein
MSEREERFAAAERLLEQYFEQRAQAGGEALRFEAFAANHADLATELRELYAACGEVDDGLLRGQQALAAQQAQVREVLESLRSSSDFQHRYAIESEVGKGGMGAVFRVRLIQDLVRGAWLRFVRKLPANQKLVGEETDLAAFMFGSERVSLQQFVPVLRELQEDRCFYCARRLGQAKVCVDHFVPWAMYSVDLGHNFVLADEPCNGAKSDTLAALVHLERWWRRTNDHGAELARSFDALGIAHDREASQRVATWAYDQASNARARVWVRGKDYEELRPDWRSGLGGRVLRASGAPRQEKVDLPQVAWFPSADSCA